MVLICRLHAPNHSNNDSCATFTHQRPTTLIPALHSQQHHHSRHQMDPFNNPFGPFPGAAAPLLLHNQQHQHALEVHRDVIAMFPELDLTEIIRQSGHLNSETLASLIVDRMAQIPKKRPDGNAAAAPGPARREDHNDDASSDEDEVEGDLLIDKMLAQLLRTVKQEMRDHREAPPDRRKGNLIKSFILDKFQWARIDFIDKILKQLRYQIVPVSIACFLAENNYGQRLRPVLPLLKQKFWNISAVRLVVRRRIKNYRFQWPDDILAPFNRYVELMTRLQAGEFEALLYPYPYLRLKEQHNQVRWERPEPAMATECLVCFTKFSLNLMVQCDPPPPQQHNNNTAAAADDDDEEEDDKDTPGPSSRIQQKPRQPVEDEEEDEDSSDDEEDSNDDDDEEEDMREEGEATTAKTPSAEELVRKQEQPPRQHQRVQTHAFCRDCIRGQAAAATEEVPLADGGVGLRCMVPDCKNRILFNEIQELLKPEVRRKLEERIIEENLGMASIPNLERCRRCNFAIQMDVDRQTNKVFSCLNCGAKFCRICECPWDDDHFGVSCEELGVKMHKDRKLRDLEKELNEAVVRKCPKCNVLFVKDLGCNKMTCRCGMTQCYICRKSSIGYDHFCQHYRDPKNPDFKCDKCNKTCLLFEDPKKKDEQTIREIQLKNLLAADKEAGPSTSTQKPPAGTAAATNERR